MKTSLLTLTVACTMLSCAQAPSTSETASSAQETAAIMEDVSNDTFLALMADKPEALLLDVRTPEEWNDGHLEGASHADYWGDEQAFQAAMDAIPRDRPVLVYCAGGGRSGLTAKELIKAGHHEVYNLENGISGWIAEGHPVVTGPPAQD
ncbi:rhodanese-like domain-containing protein [Flavobacteriales bacterium]|nr:rhodanese-like domain-containing protein [Flavobacteriales bacterium]